MFPLYRFDQYLHEFNKLNAGLVSNKVGARLELISDKRSAFDNDLLGTLSEK